MSPALDNEGTKRIQGIVGALLYYTRAVDNKLLVSLSAIGAQQAAATQRTNEAINKNLIIVSHTPPIRYSITKEIWFFVLTLTPDFTTRSKYAADQELTCLYPKMTPCQSVTVQFSLCPRL